MTTPWRSIERCKAKGLTPTKKPFVGNRCWVVEFKDPDGHTLYFESETDAAEESELEE